MTPARFGLALAAGLMMTAFALTPGPLAKKYPVNWLEGCWQTEAGMREVWDKAGDDLPFGCGTVPVENCTALFEQLRIERIERDDTDWRYLADRQGIFRTVFYSHRTHKSAGRV